MRARFIGDEEDVLAKLHGLARGGEYNISLIRTNLFSRIILRWSFLAVISVCGRKFSCPYGSMKAFEANWKVK